ncbi:hypothetical protein PYW07_016965 [Mythimna separata]|uniref:Uncharacterized protein n=1 Tax=Mythimna separata TaxID=271217 RepID=A0AAD7YUG6_MYTSE|nr:hypothetical protein PYW07_016965 [Mythimna separata]
MLELLAMRRATCSETWVPFDVNTRTATKQRWLGLRLCDEPAEGEGMDEPSAAKRPSVLTIDRAAFLLLRVKRAFKKKRQQRKEKQ